MQERIIALVLVLCVIGGCTIFRGEESVSQYADNAALTTKVKTALVQDDRVSATKIHVESIRRHTVVLSGVVKHGYQKQAAAEIASGVSGVKSVVNNIAIIE